MTNNIDALVIKYQSKRNLYETLAKKVRDIIQEVIKNNSIQVANITYRAKEVDSFRDKASKDKYSDPINQIMDMVGIRVITYVESDIQKICKIIECLFDIDPENSSDKSSQLDVNSFGYRSMHYVAKLTKERSALPEYNIFADICFEIQICTILAHAWAEIEHDRNYKFNGILPKHLQRRFAIAAGLLELADMEFNNISSEIDNYAHKVSESAKEGNLNIDIDSTSVKEYMDNKFGDKLRQIRIGETIIDELSKFGIYNLQALEQIIPADLVDKLSRNRTSVGLLRNIMIINNADKYFERVYNHDWLTMADESVELLRSYNVPLDKYRDIYGFNYELAYSRHRNSKKNGFER